MTQGLVFQTMKLEELFSALGMLQRIGYGFLELLQVVQALNRDFESLRRRCRGNLLEFFQCSRLRWREEMPVENELEEYTAQNPNKKDAPYVSALEIRTS